ncbi:ketopantoate reductase family protein [Natronomonas sp. LN261]|jgi:2-dehydropantoate 2-reductase|uniref:ketopantoate reductase family protein n=1 Tax=Natronomonas sp. LN261 TaxID=2750669 RepID=UPI0015EF4585|nr:2-dehydropantoate 2-reductase [Natronomonas sp. LN261]
MDVLVFGAGSLGSLLGGLLAREHDVTLVGRDPHMRTVAADGLQLRGRIEATVRPTARLDPPASADLAVICVKAFDTGSAAADLADCDLDACLSVQNGMGNEAVLADRLDAPILAGTCTYGAVRPAPGVVRCTGVGDVVLGPPEGGVSPVADRVGEAFGSASIGTSVTATMPGRLWEKLAVNAAINPVTALARIENGGILDGDAAALASAAARETAAVARAEGIELSDRAARQAMERVAAATAENTSSMHQDVAAGRRTEIDAINGHVLERADERGLDVPTNRTLTRLVRAWEVGHGIR